MNENSTPEKYRKRGSRQGTEAQRRKVDICRIIVFLSVKAPLPLLPRNATILTMVKRTAINRQIMTPATGYHYIYITCLLTVSIAY